MSLMGKRTGNLVQRTCLQPNVKCEQEMNVHLSISMFASVRDTSRIRVQTVWMLSYTLLTVQHFVVNREFGLFVTLHPLDYASDSLAQNVISKVLSWHAVHLYLNIQSTEST